MKEIKFKGMNEQSPNSTKRAGERNKETRIGSAEVLQFQPKQQSEHYSGVKGILKIAEELY